MFSVSHSGYICHSANFAFGGNRDGFVGAEAFVPRSSAPSYVPGCCMPKRQVWLVVVLKPAVKINQKENSGGGGGGGVVVGW
jgi:hypothetical protein